MKAPARVIATPLAEEWLGKLTQEHGALLLHQSGGCCDGSAPMCYLRDEFKIGASDVCLGDVKGTPVYMSASQFSYWQHTQLIIDVVPGRGSGFSLEAPEGIRFLTRSRVFNDEEIAALKG
ncbi:DUF779 domain-containing protein [Legionella rowbothamii]|uniref:DUF779 domain-containing protein n=1 Tax=Legionella rowbothamii TaxID=96229 RepID=UPI0010544235|nr:DUF779 domain-containing protein [Legionella rowbothamii]